MPATGTRTQSVNEWHSVLLQLDETLQASLRNLNEQEQWVAVEDESPADTEMEIEARLDRRIRQLSARVAEAEQSADDVGAALASAEEELRRWAANIEAIAHRVDMISR